MKIFLVIAAIVFVVGCLIISNKIDKAVKEKCDGCDMAELTKGIACDTCYDGSNYRHIEDNH